jgi:hypothetical protein
VHAGRARCLRDPLRQVKRRGTEHGEPAVEGAPQCGVIGNVERLVLHARRRRGCGCQRAKRRSVSIGQCHGVIIAVGQQIGHDLADLAGADDEDIAAHGNSLGKPHAACRAGKRQRQDGRNAGYESAE